MNSSTPHITANTITFAKLRNGEWGIKGQASAVKAAVKDRDSLVVVTKSGDTKTVWPTAVVWTGKGIAIAAIEQTRKPSPSRQRYAPECSECGAHGPAGQACKECYEGHFC